MPSGVGSEFLRAMMKRHTENHDLHGKAWMASAVYEPAQNELEAELELSGLVGWARIISGLWTLARAC